VVELDTLDQLAARAFDGYIVRKDLALRFKGQYPVPTYVGEFLLGRYCASIDEEEIAEGLSIVETQMRERTVRAGEEELFKAHAREYGSIKLIDLVMARLDATTDSYVATLPSLRLADVAIADEFVVANQRMLTGGFYAEVTLSYDAVMEDRGKGARPFAISALRPIQLSKRGVLDDLAAGRERFSTADWKRFLLRSIGLEPDALSSRAIALKFALAPQIFALNRNDAAHPAEHLAIGPYEPATVILRATGTQWINRFCRTNSSAWPSVCHSYAII